MELWRERALAFIIYLIIKILIIDWSKLNHVTRRKSTYHCLEGLGVLSFDLRSNDSTPKPCDRSSNPSATFAHTYHCCVTMVAMSCCAICALVLLCRTEFQCNSLWRNNDTEHWYHNSTRLKLILKLFYK